MKSLELIDRFNLSDLAYKCIFHCKSDEITQKQLDNSIYYNSLYFSKLYNSLNSTDKQLIKAKILLNGKVFNYSFGAINQYMLRLDNHINYLYSFDLKKVSYHFYYVDKLKSAIYSTLQEEEIKEEQEREFTQSLEALKESILAIENKAIPDLPMDFVFENLKCLTYKIPKLNEQYLSYEEFCAFLRIGFGLEPLPKVTANIPPRHIGTFIRVFHSLFDKGCHKYSLPAKFQPFISLIERSFTNFNEVQIKQNLRRR